jgi:hypothetical protein
VVLDNLVVDILDIQAGADSQAAAAHSSHRNAHNNLDCYDRQGILVAEVAHQSLHSLEVVGSLAVGILLEAADIQHQNLPSRLRMLEKRYKDRKICTDRIAAGSSHTDQEHHSWEQPVGLRMHVLVCHFPKRSLAPWLVLLRHRCRCSYLQSESSPYLMAAHLSVAARVDLMHMGLGPHIDLRHATCRLE